MDFVSHLSSAISKRRDLPLCLLYSHIFDNSIPVGFWLQASSAVIRNHGMHWTTPKLPYNDSLFSDSICWISPYHICVCWSSWRYFVLSL